MNRTCLYDLHTRLGGKMVEFGGWEMPLMYSSIVQEHHATRQGCTMFDVSHMGRIYVSGTGTTNFLDELCTRNIAAMSAGQSRYTHICNESGGILDDLIVSRLESESYLLVCNASNREKILGWAQRHANGRGLDLQDHTRTTAMVALQGPQTMALADELLPFEVSDVKRYHFKTGKYMGIDYLCSRTGYTGEEGLEIIVTSAAGRMLAENIVDPKSAVRGRVVPAGLGARDTLRLEAGMPLYGHELHEQTDPISAGQAWCVDLAKSFIGQEAIRRVHAAGPKQRLVGLEIEGRRIARPGADIAANGRTVGRVSSGTLSPTLNKVIAMGSVQADHTATGTALEVDIRGKAAKARIVPLPFYRRGA